MHATGGLSGGAGRRAGLVFAVFAVVAACALASPGSAGALQHAPAAGPPSGMSEGAAFASSLVLPGLAQHRQGQRRWLAYAGAEAAALAAFVLLRSDASALRQDYRDFAWEAARAGVGAGPRAEGAFEYYERLARWDASGRWDADARAHGLQPESDPLTYNGSVWSLAVEIFDLDPSAPDRSPGYARAIEYYRLHGYGPAYLWAWSAGTDRTRFAGLIQESDSRFKDARLALGILMANHLVSAVDGLVTARLRIAEGRGAVGLAVSVPIP